MHSNNRKFMRLWNAQCSMCYDCGDRDQPNNMTLHHIPPRSKRGNDSSGSNVVLCRACHDKRHAPANNMLSVSGEREKRND